MYYKNYSKQKWVIVCVVVDIVVDAAADTVVDAAGISNRFHRLTVFGKPMTLNGGLDFHCYANTCFLINFHCCGIPNISKDSICII